MRFARLLHVLLAILLVLCAPAARAAVPGPAPMSQYMLPFEAARLTTQPINVACASDIGNTDTPLCASFELDTRGYKSVVLIIRYVRTSASAVQLYKDDAVVTDAGGLGAPPWGIQQLGDALAPPTVTMGAEARVWTVSASDTWQVKFAITAPYTRFRFTSTGGAAGDTVTVYAVLIGG